MENINYSHMTMQELNHRAETLKELCHRLDPYDTIAPEDLKSLQSIGISITEDPFHLTNTLILYVEDTLEEISKRQKLH